MLKRYLFYFTSGSLAFSALMAVPSAPLYAIENEYGVDDFYEDKGVHESQQSQNLERDIYDQEVNVEQQTIQDIEKNKI